MKMSVTWLSRGAGLASMLLILGCITVPETMPKVEPGFRDYAVMTYHVVPGHVSAREAYVALEAGPLGDDCSGLLGGK